MKQQGQCTHAWFHDKEVGMCRVVEFGGFKTKDGTMEPMLYYDYFDQNGEVETDSSTLIEVQGWVEEDKTNINL